ncbi:MAG: hypothetical protein K2G55_02505 [Lachnospiraceae bacterium]|nr:hypothetical protein [Lachnospiraceae bacterium]MDE7204505.1 hypothetical protein [Lachnospiraceae bacterium]
MRAEETLQFMMDFYPEVYPTGKYCLNHLFCSIGSGYEWWKGELVDKTCKFSKRYRLVETIEKVGPRNEEYYQARLEMEKEIRKEKGDSYRITPHNIIYNFEWSTPSKKYSYIYHYPKNIKEDWLALLKECEQMLIEERIIHGDNQVEGLEELQEKQSGGIQMV